MSNDFLKPWTKFEIQPLKFSFWWLLSSNLLVRKFWILFWYPRCFTQRKFCTNCDQKFVVLKPTPLNLVLQSHVLILAYSVPWVSLVFLRFFCLVDVLVKYLNHINSYNFHSFSSRNKSKSKRSTIYETNERSYWLCSYLWTLTFLQWHNLTHGFRKMESWSWKIAIFFSTSVVSDGIQRKLNLILEIIFQYKQKPKVNFGNIMRT